MAESTKAEIRWIWVWILAAPFTSSVSSFCCSFHIYKIKIIEESQWELIKLMYFKSLEQCLIQHESSQERLTQQVHKFSGTDCIISSAFKKLVAIKAQLKQTEKSWKNKRALHNFGCDVNKWNGFFPMANTNSLTKDALLSNNSRAHRSSFKKVENCRHKKWFIKGKITTLWAKTSFYLNTGLLILAKQSLWAWHSTE